MLLTTTRRPCLALAACRRAPHACGRLSSHQVLAMHKHSLTSDITSQAGAGMGRAPAVALAYMWWVLGMHLEEAHALLLSRRRCARQTCRLQSNQNNSLPSAHLAAEGTVSIQARFHVPWRHCAAQNAATLPASSAAPRCVCVQWLSSPASLAHVPHHRLTRCRCVHRCVPKLHAIREATSDILYGGDPQEVTLTKRGSSCSKSVLVAGAHLNCFDDKQGNNC
jgi:hypothetical protein